MGKQDPRFVTDESFAGEAEAGPSHSVVQTSDIEDSMSDHDNLPEPLAVSHEDASVGQGMDPEGFAGPRVLKPLTPEALAAFQAAQNKAGVIYISRIPPGMRPTKVRHLMSQYGEVGRVYLQQEGAYRRPLHQIESLIFLQMPSVRIFDASSQLQRRRTTSKDGLSSRTKRLRDR